jgi:catechol 2,3-dioxygenase-like lactoylglutathione lyase family enzyme
MQMQLPTPVHKPAFDITRASHIVHRVQDLAASRAFYVDLIGLVVSDEDSETLWLRGLEEGCHHSLVLKSGEPQCERVGLRVRTEEDLELLEAHFARAIRVVPYRPPTRQARRSNSARLWRLDPDCSTTSNFIAEHALSGWIIFR